MLTEKQYNLLMFINKVNKETGQCPSFDEMKCERVTLDYMTGNEIAHNLYIKTGLKDEGCMRHGGKKNGGYVDLNLMSILKDEYYSR